MPIVYYHEWRRNVAPVLEELKDRTAKLHSIAEAPFNFNWSNRPIYYSKSKYLSPFEKTWYYTLAEVFHGKNAKASDTFWRLFEVENH
jgi:hypothetical protein